MRVSKAWIGKKLNEIPDNPDALAELYAAMKQPMYAVAYRMVLSREDAEDVVQEAFMSLMRIREGGRIKNGSAYLFQIVRNEALRRLRLRDRETACENPEVYIRHTGRGGWNDVDRAMATLSADERQIVAMHTEAGLTYSEIAKVTGSSTATVFRQYRKALGKLQKYFNVSSSFEGELV
ncbi:MAG: sigma-70 family RNA polymerase sigma factor [Lachnospiraceae bacterium]|nr:sigma-70 family RNA polymerase sigma factor [Lachnospiraceae bacterium]